MLKNIIIVILLFQFFCVLVNAEDSRILATGGATQIEGSAGGGIVPWAVIAGYAQEGEWGATAFTTFIKTDDFSLSSYGLAIGFENRFEFSIARQSFNLGPLQSQLGLPSNKLEQNIFGFKAKLYGDLIYDSLPQISFGIQHKELDDFAIPSIVGATDDEGDDFYLTASKLWLQGLQGYPILTTVTLRSTTANQIGLLGYGGDINESREVVIELNTSLLISRNWLLGYEYRQKPDNLGFACEDDWQDIYLAWFYDKSVSAVFAYVDLGSVASLEKQQGFYLSLQATF